MPVVTGENWIAGEHYKVFHNPRSKSMAPTKHPEHAVIDCAEVEAGLDWLLTGDNWRGVAEAAKSYALSCHTWQVRATELRQIVHEELRI